MTKEINQQDLARYSEMLKSGMEPFEFYSVLVSERVSKLSIISILRQELKLSYPECVELEEKFQKRAL